MTKIQQHACQALSYNELGHLVGLQTPSGCKDIIILATDDMQQSIKYKQSNNFTNTRRIGLLFRSKCPQ
jgi:hypothetical protein